MCSQRKMPAFSSNLLGDKIFESFLRFSGELPEIPWKLCVVSARKRSHGSPFSYFDPMMFGKRSGT